MIVFKETSRRQHKIPIKRKRGEYKDEQEGGPKFLIAKPPPLCV